VFGIFASPARKMRENAAHWLELADKVYLYRRDVLAHAQVAELQSQTAALRRLLKDKAETMKLKLAVESLEEVLRRTGGTHYPKSSLVENVEFFLVAAIVILGFRTYFVQPFKIPTNSMWPTYNGMTPEVFRQGSDEPGYIHQAVRLAAFGARPKRVDAKTGGEIFIPLIGNNERVIIPYRNVAGRSWLIFPATHKEYTLLVGDDPVTVRVPADFDFEWTIRDAFFPEARANHEPAGADLARLLGKQTELLRDGTGRVRFLKTGRKVKAGERALAFDILTGDQLFVDRMSYHFTRPSVGQGFVFRTRQITGIGQDQYYIKRLVGVPGDELEIQNYGLFRNGVPITGADAFAANAARSGNYVGYRNELGLAKGHIMKVPPESFLALGDNSANSQDGRYWGYVPAKDAIGRPLFIYYPFTKHWGPAR
jgi:signal peptidase I